MNRCWTLILETQHQLHIINLFKKIIMSKLPCERLKLKYFETDDTFLVTEFIYNRIKSIPIASSGFNMDNDLPVNQEFEIKYTNPISQEVCVYSDHIRKRDNPKEDP